MASATQWLRFHHATNTFSSLFPVCVHRARPPRRCWRAPSSASSNESAKQKEEGKSRRFAVVGGGFAGVAVAWNLLAMTVGHGSISVDLFDAVGLAGGGSGASAGLLHPYTANGKMLWHGREALIAALKLISAAELAARIEENPKQPFVWRQSILRPAANARQAAEFAELARIEDRVASMMASPVRAEQALQMVPGLDEEVLLTDTDAAALLIQGGLVLDPHRYIRALWGACLQITKDAGRTAELRLVKEKVASLTELEARHGPYTAVVVAAGAANEIIEDVGDKLGCGLSQGYILQLAPALPAPLASPTQQPGAEAQGTSLLLHTAARPGAAEALNEEQQTIHARIPEAQQPQEEPLDPQMPTPTTLPKPSQTQEPELRWPQVPSSGTDPHSNRALSLAQMHQQMNDPLEALEGPASGGLNEASPSTEGNISSGGASPANQSPSRSASENKNQSEVSHSGRADDGISKAPLKAPANTEFIAGTEPELQVLGQNPELDSCLRESASSAWQSQQQQIREAIGLQIDPTRSLTPDRTSDSRLQDGLSDGWDSDEDLNGVSYAEGYPEGAPSLLSSKYLAAQGKYRLILGGTRRKGLTAEQAFQECGRVIWEEAERDAAIKALLPEAEKLWKPVSKWRVRRVRSGVRAMPPKTEKGSLPLAGRIENDRRWWVIGGLGARGLMYHAWLGELVAQAVLNDSEDGLPKELLRWKSCDITDKPN